MFSIEFDTQAHRPRGRHRRRRPRRPRPHPRRQRPGAQGRRFQGPASSVGVGH